MNKAELIISKLDLKPHIEGGFFSETYKSPHLLKSNDIKVEFEGQRPLVSTIYFLLKSGQISEFHILKFDEQWFFHDGSSLLIHLIDQKGNIESIKLGSKIYKDEKPQLLIKAGVIMGAEVIEKNSYSLVSCVVSPGFDYRDFKIFSSEELIKQYPQHKKIITKFTN